MKFCSLSTNKRNVNGNFGIGINLLNWLILWFFSFSLSVLFLSFSFSAINFYSKSLKCISQDCTITIFFLSFSTVKMINWLRFWANTLFRNERQKMTDKNKDSRTIRKQQFSLRAFFNSSALKISQKLSQFYFLTVESFTKIFMFFFALRWKRETKKLFFV